MRFIFFIIGYLFYPISFLIPRSKKKWAFGSFRKGFNDNAKYLFIYASENYKDIDIVWLSASKETVQKIQEIGFNAMYIGSIRGVWQAMRSKYWFVNANTSDILFFASGNATCINLWHGIALKKIEFCIASGELADRYVKKSFRERFFHPEAFRRPDYLISVSPFQTEKFAEAFRIPLKRCLHIGYPRNNILICDEKERNTFIQKYEPESTRTLIDSFKQYETIYVYMPTWRESQKDIFSTHLNLTDINTIMREQKSLFIIKPHANTSVEGIDFSQYQHVIWFKNNADIYPVLPYTHVLITDYSSILYDYILMKNKDVILYLYDFQEYVDMRDFNYPFEESVVGKKVCTFEELYASISSKDYKIDEEKREEIILRFWGENSNNPNEKIISKFHEMDPVHLLLDSPEN